MRKIECARRQDASGHTITRHCHRSGALQRGRKHTAYRFLWGKIPHGVLPAAVLPGTLRLRNRKVLFSANRCAPVCRKKYLAVAQPQGTRQYGSWQNAVRYLTPQKTICSVFPAPLQSAGPVTMPRYGVPGGVLPPGTFYFSHHPLLLQ